MPITIGRRELIAGFGGLVVAWPFSVQAQPAETDFLHLAAVDRHGTIWHTIRNPDGSWTPFGNVNAVVGQPGGAFSQAAAAQSDLPGELDLAGLDGHGTIWHTIRHPNGSWEPFGNVNRAVAAVNGSFPASFSWAAIAGGPGAGGLHVTGVASSGDILHTIDNRGWIPWGDVSKVVGHPGGSFSRVAVGFVGLASGPSSDLHLAGVDGHGTIWHTIRHGDGSWTPFGNVNQVVGGGPFSAVSVAGVAVGELQLAAPDGHGTIWHTIRHGDGSWTPFGNVNQVVGGGPFSAVSVARVAGELQLAAVDGHGTIWHTIRHGDGSWTPFGNVNEVVGQPGGAFSQVAVAQVAIGTFQ
jgi:hypothetical protein